MEALELALQRGPGSKHCIDYSLEDRVAIDQLTDARVEPTAADGTNLQAEAAEHAADAALDVEQLGLDQLARSEERTHLLRTDRFRVHRPIPAKPQQLGNAAGPQDDSRLWSRERWHLPR